MTGGATIEKPRASGPGSGVGDNWRVIVLNDDHNTFQGVAFALSNVLPGVSYDKGMELANRIQGFLRAQMPVWRGRHPGVENMHVAVMGCVVNGPGESKHANVGISLPGSGERASSRGA